MCGVLKLVPFPKVYLPSQKRGRKGQEKIERDKKRTRKGEKRK